MKVKSFMDKWYDNNFYDGGGSTTKEYSNFQQNYRSVLKEIGSDIGFELYSFSKNHYEFSAVMQSIISKQFYYISISDVRYWKNEWADYILYRTMEHEKDWTGRSNQYSSLNDLSENLIKLDKQIIKNLELKNNSQVSCSPQTEKTVYEDFENEYGY